MNLADRRDGHGDSGSRFSLTYFAGPSAAPLGSAEVICWSERRSGGSAGAAAGAAGAAAPLSAASAAAAQGGPGGA
jgi:hypothetical protein